MHESLDHYTMCVSLENLVGLQIIASCAEFVFLLKSISPSFVVLILQQRRPAKLPFCSHLSLFTPFLLVAGCEGLP